MVWKNWYLALKASSQQMTIANEQTMHHFERSESKDFERVFNFVLSQLSNEILQIK